MKHAGEIETLIDEGRIAARVRALGAQITQDYAGRELVLVCVLKGSFVFCADLARAIDLPIAIEFLGLKSYGDAQTTSGVVQITSDLQHPVAGKDLLIVEDIVDTGLTMAYLRKNLATRGPRSVKLCALLHKPSRARVDTPHRLPRLRDRRRVRGRLRARLGRALPQLAFRRRRATGRSAMSKRLELFDKLIAGGSQDPFHHYARAMELRSTRPSRRLRWSVLRRFARNSPTTCPAT